MITVEMTIKANVKVTPEVKEGLRREYGCSEKTLQNDEWVAKAMLYAYLNPKLADCTYEFIWDGVANLNGLIGNIEMEETES
ncbi:hypothetical protein FLT15_07145 [Paenibacillus thiaminolyticus]|uniref:hypothetical protein n=1 Tax=Paenibacillus thiaminolyticus TaxID=49283 RepID=UPI001163573A|nr:hypothetical protein [Paenibacillus thiaminolyticus]NGP58174.1 hypothetical protein [Paenibacillus thiaminolyticus]